MNLKLQNDNWRTLLLMHQKQKEVIQKQTVMLQGSISLPYYLSIINQGHGNILFRMKLGMCRFFTAIYNPFVCSLDVVIVVAVADH